MSERNDGGAFLYEFKAPLDLGGDGNFLDVFALDEKNITAKFVAGRKII